MNAVSKDYMYVSKSNILKITKLTLITTLNTFIILFIFQVAWKERVNAFFRPFVSPINVLSVVISVSFALA